MIFLIIFHSFAHASVFKSNKNKVTIAPFVNASGSQKLKPIVIGCSFIFEIIIKKFNSYLRSESKNAILLVDDARCHKFLHLDLSNLKIHYLPSNTTAHLQPLDAGIIKNELYIDKRSKKFPVTFFNLKFSTSQGHFLHSFNN